MSLSLFQAFVPPPRGAFVETAFSRLVEEIDRLAITDLGGIPILYRPAIGAAVPVTGIFDQNYVLDKGTAEDGVETLGPAVFVRLEDLPADPEDDEPTLTIGTAEYHVIERRPDDMGGVVLVLRLVA